jgi:ATP-dependent Clp protease adaptor protein ClpS
MTAKEDTRKETSKNSNEESKNERFLILHNDDYHSFDYVIEALVEICDHDYTQAEQCTMLTHFKGQCDVKKGSFAYLSPMRKALIAKELKATID